VGPGVPDALRRLAFDPQTSGGLLLAVEPGATGHLLGRLADANVAACVVGRVEPPADDTVLIRLA
jgi:selenide,water dikinase